LKRAEREEAARSTTVFEKSTNLKDMLAQYQNKRRRTDEVTNAKTTTDL
jgi:hypothetical protein